MNHALLQIQIQIRFDYKVKSLQLLVKGAPEGDFKGKAEGINHEDVLHCIT